jgi:FkbM family methyltransferase
LSIVGTRLAKFYSGLRRASKAAAFAARHPKQSYRALYAATREPTAPPTLSAAERFTAAMTLLTGLDLSLQFERDGVAWTVPPGEDGIAEELFEHGAYSGDTTRTMLDFVASRRASHKWIVDVGANIGSSTLPFAASGYKVVAIEPVRSTLRLLRSNIDKNGHSERVCIVEGAVADGVDEVLIAQSTSFGNSEVVPTSTAPAGFERRYGRGATTRVRAFGLDEAVASCGVAPESVALVWSDTQGSEMAVIKTGLSFWRVGVPLFVEFWLSGIEMKGGLSAFIDCASEHFSEFIDAANGGRDVRGALESADLDPGGRLPARPVSELPDLAEAVLEYPGQFTDILLLPRVVL